VSPLVAVAILALAALIMPALLYLRSVRGRKPWVEDIPSAMRPGYSDEELAVVARFLIEMTDVIVAHQRPPEPTA